eukprot:5899338-Prymnesium_polylepis.2
MKLDGKVHVAHVERDVLHPREPRGQRSHVLARKPKPAATHGHGPAPGSGRQLCEASWGFQSCRHVPEGVRPDQLCSRAVLQFADPRGWVGRKACDRGSRELLLGQTEPALLIVRWETSHLQTLYLIALGL